MGVCGCSGLIKNNIFKIGNKYILIEEYPYCDFCMVDSLIQISEISAKDIKNFDNIKILTLSKWMDNNDKTQPFFIDPLKVRGIKKQLENNIDLIFDKCWNKIDINDKSVKLLQNINEDQWEILIKNFVLEFKKIIK